MSELSTVPRPAVAVAEAEHQVAAAPERNHARVAWRMPAIATPVLVYLLSRVAVLGSALVATWYQRRLTIGQALSGWDGSWYLMIARSGYPSNVAREAAGGDRWAFFPGLPAVVKGVASVTGLSYEHAGILTAFIFGATAAIAVWLAVRQVLGSEVARFTVVLVCFFPAAFSLSMVYAEGMFLTFAALCIYFLGARRWELAGIAASIACITRVSGVVLVLACVVVGLRFAISRREWRPLTAVVLAPLGFLAWSGYQLARTGSPLAFLKAEKLWGGGFVWFTTPFKSLWHLVSQPSTWSSAGDVVAAGALVFVLVGAVLLARLAVQHRTVPLEWLIYAAGSALIALSPYWPVSVPRYSLVAFPLFAAIAAHVPKRFESSMAGSLAMLQGALATVVFVGIITWQTAPLVP